MRFFQAVIVALATAAATINAQRVHVSHKKAVRGANGEFLRRDLQKGGGGGGNKFGGGGGNKFGGGGGNKVGGGGGCNNPSGCTKRPSPAPADQPSPTPVATPVSDPTDTPVASPVASPTEVISTPSELFSGSDNKLFETIYIEQATFTIPGTSFSINSRLLNGQYPGPTLRIKPGDTIDILFENDLEDLGSVHVNNVYSGNDISNMHFHGLHVSGELPSDDVTHKVYPGESYNYITTLIDEHMPGTHWQHPHVHGSTSLQVGGGAFQAIIVEDPDGFLPDQIANAREVLFLAHYWHRMELENVVSQSGDTVFSTTMSGMDRQTFREFVTVNGQYQPAIYIDANEWVRLRVVWANFKEGDLDLGITGCEMNLLAKDGIYIRDFPRSITDAQVVPGGRADIMVRCPTPSTTYDVNGIVDGMATIVTSATTQTSSDLVSWTPNYPDYLTDLTGQSVTSGCSCDTAFSGATMSVNNIQFPDNGSYLHQTYLGAIASRTISANAHPYHQHVYPFQLVGSSLATGYNAVGDWHDTIKGSGEIRFRPTEFTGKLMLHCHRLIHEDLGMMAMEYVAPSSGGSCWCTSRQGTR